MPQSKRVWSLSMSEWQKFQRLDIEDAAYGSVHNLVKASNVGVWKVRQFLHWEISYTEFTLVTRKFKILKAFASFRNEIWYMDQAYVHKLAKTNSGVKYLLNRRDLFDRTVDEKRMKKKDSKETRKAFSTKHYKKESSQKNPFKRWQSVLGRLKNSLMLKGYKSGLQSVRPRLFLLNVQYDL